MKFYVVASAAAAAILSIGVNAQERCNPCPGGITADPNTETIPGKTCGTVQEDAAQFSATSNVCDLITADTKDICCPDVVAPVFESCSVCSDGLTVPDNTEVPNTGGITCGTMMNAAKQAAEGGNVCTQMKESEGTCCPENPASGEPTTCSVCKNGIPKENEKIQTTGSGKTCKDLLVDAPKFEEGSNVCNIMKSSEELCCPFVATTTAATTTVQVTTTFAAAAEIITSSPTAPTPTVSPTIRPTPSPTPRDQMFGNILPTPTNSIDNNSGSDPTPTPPTPPASNPDPTYSPTDENVYPTYSPTYNDLAGRGKQPPGFVLPGDNSDSGRAPSSGVSVDFRLGFAVTLCLSVCGVMFA